MAAKEITVDAALEKGEELTAFVESMLEPYDPSPKATIQVDVAIDEVFSNIVMYSGAKTVTVVANLDEPTSVFSLTWKKRIRMFPCLWRSGKLGVWASFW